MKSRPRFSLLLIVLGMNVLFVIAPAAPAAAWAPGSYVLDPWICQNPAMLGGFWIGSKCTIGGLPSPYIPSGVQLIINDITRLWILSKFENFGRINNTGTIFTTELINNWGAITNGGIITNMGTIANWGGSIFNAYLGTLENRDGGTIENRSTIANRDGGTIINNGTITNMLGGTLENWGTIDNSGTGTINNYCDATILGDGIVTGNAINYPDDVDGDGVCDDVDNDGVLDRVDNCPTVVNSDQADADEDGIGDACEEPVGMSLFSNALVMLPVALLAGTFIVLYRRRKHPPVN